MMVFSDFLWVHTSKKKHFPILIFGAHIAFECTTKNGIQSAKINFMFVKCTVYLRTEFRKKCKQTLRIAFARVFLVFALVPLLLWTLYIPMHCMHRCESEKNGYQISLGEQQKRYTNRTTQFIYQQFTLYRRQPTIYAQCV